MHLFENRKVAGSITGKIGSNGEKYILFQKIFRGIWVNFPQF